MNFACLYIPDLPVQAVVRLEPDLRGRAVAVVEPEPLPARVFALNEAARKAGAEGGMSQVETALYPGVEVRRRSPAAEASAHAALLDLARSFSPRFEDVAPDTAALDLGGLETLLGPAQKIARSLEERARELGLEANIALAPNPDAARLAARGFAGITLIGAGEEAERLGELPVEALGCSPEMQQTLERWGVRTFQALAALPPEELSERLGQEGLRLRSLACGGELRALVPAEEPLHFEEAMDLEYPVAEIEPLAFILGRLLHQVCVRLAARGCATQKLRLVLGVDASGIESGEVEGQGSKGESEAAFALQPSTFNFFDSRSLSSESRTLSLPVPVRDSRLLFKLWLLDLEARPPSAPVAKLAVTAEPTRPRVAQGDLFLPRAPDPQRLELTFARLKGVVGEGRSGSPELLDTHRPDAFQVRRFTGVDAPEIKRRESKAESQKSGMVHPKPGTGRQLPEKRLQILDFQLRVSNPGHRASVSGPRVLSPEPRPLMRLRFFRPPLAAKVVVRAGRPFRVEARGVQGRVTAVAGPWRTSGGWWTGDSWERDEWDVEVSGPGWAAASLGSMTKAGSRRAEIERARLYRIHCNRRNGQWFVSGLYD